MSTQMLGTAHSRLISLLPRLDAAYTNLLRLTRNAQDAEVPYAEAVAALARRKQEIIVDNAENPKALGANEAARDANIAAMCPDEREALDTANAKRMLCRDELALAQIALDHVRALLRLSEAEAAMLSGGLESPR